MNNQQQQPEAVERVLISECRDQQRKRLEGAERIEKDTKHLAELFAGLELGEFNADVLRDVYTTGGRKVKQRYTEAVKAEMEALKSPILRKAMAGNVANYPTPFFREAQRVKDSADPNTFGLIQYMEITAEGAQLTEEGKARLIDDARHYTTDPEEIAKHREYLELMQRLDAFFEHGKAMPLNGWFNVFRINAQNRFIYPDEGVNYAFFISRREEAEGDAGTPEPMPEIIPTEREEPKQQNKTVGNVTKGITKAPPKSNAATELRNRNLYGRTVNGRMEVTKPDTVKARMKVTTPRE